MNNRLNGDRLPSLTSLELQNNNLKNLPEFICQLKNLENIDLSSNLLTHLDLGCFKSGQLQTINLKQINLNNNPLQCDCKMRGLKAWLMSTYDEDLLDLIMWQCANLKQKFLVNVEMNEMICYEPTLPITVQTTTTTTTTTVKQSTSFPPLTSEPKTTHLPIYITNTESITSTTSQVPKAKSEPSRAKDTMTMDISLYSLIIGVSLGKILKRFFVPLTYQKF